MKTLYEVTGDITHINTVLVPRDEAGWIKTIVRRPDAGRLIVKRWKSGAVWAGVYSGTEKDSSFDEWVYLPN